MSFEWRGFLNGVIALFEGMLTLYMIVILIRVVASWIGADLYNPVMKMLCSLTDPLFDAIRRKLPRGVQMVGLDFAPLIAVIMLLIVSIFLNHFSF